MKKGAFVLVAGLCVSPAKAGRIAEIAATMAPGTVAELTGTTNIGVLNTDQVTGPVLGYTEGSVWDPISRQWFTCAGSHNGNPNLWSYSDITNTWSKADLPWTGNSTMHGYDHTAIDIAGRAVYHRVYGSNSAKVHKYDIGAQTWSAAPDINTNDYLGCCGSLTYFPEMDALIYVGNNGASSNSGKIYRHKIGTSTWTDLTPAGLASLPAGTSTILSIYSPVHKIVLVAGGKAAYRVDSTGTVTRMADSPSGMTGIGATGSGSGTVATADPVSGDFIFLTSDKNLYTFNPTANAWTGESVAAWPYFYYQYATWGMVAAPIEPEGVVLYVGTRETSVKAFLYKHSAGGTGREVTAEVKAEKEIGISPNPVHGRAMIRHPFSAAAIYNIRGELVERIHENKEGETFWTPRELPCGVYLLRAADGRSRSAKKFLLQ